MRAVEPWIERPLAAFLDESAARMVAVLTKSGQVIAQHGFPTAPDLMAAAGLAAGIMAASAELSRVIGATPSRELAYQGHALGIYLAEIELPGRSWLGLVGYGKDSSLGLVQLFYGRLVSDLGRAAPPPEGAELAPILDREFEAELDRSLRALFGR